MDEQNALHTMRDWPGERFESLWTAVGSVGGSGALTKDDLAALPIVLKPTWGSMADGAWAVVQGRLEQKTPLGEVHPDGEEWFIRPHDAAPIAAYVNAPSAAVGSQVVVVGRELGVLRLADREGEIREYQAIVARTVDAAGAAWIGHRGGEAAGLLASGSGVGSAALLAALGVIVAGGWIAARLFMRRSTSPALSRIHQVAERAR